MHLDGEVWAGRGQWEASVAAVIRNDWQANICFVIFDAPQVAGDWAERLDDLTPAGWERAFWSSRFKTNNNLSATQPYACSKAKDFTRLGPLAAVLPRR